jgi:hypothetical protein
MKQQAALDYMLGQIDEESFIVRFGADPRIDSDAVHAELKEALASGSAGRVEGAMFLAVRYLLSPDWVPVLSSLLTEDWHHQHETIADALQNLRDPSSVGPLYRASTMQFDYLSYDDSSAFARKCIWALHDIGNSEAVEKLNLLSTHEREDIREYARKRLSALSARVPCAADAPYRLARNRLLRH